MSSKPKYLYTVYRNSDDRLLVLDGDVHECVRAMKVKINTFYAYVAQPHRSPYTIMRSTRMEVERDMNG